MDIFAQLKAYDFERNQICNVISIITSNLNDRQLGQVELNNGHVTFFKNHLLKECIILKWTGQYDCQKVMIYEDDLVENDEIIFKVEWNQQQTCWWLTPVKQKKIDVTDKLDVMFVMANEQLGNGYYSRKDLKKIGNYWTHKQELEIE